VKGDSNESGFTGSRFTGSGFTGTRLTGSVKNRVIRASHMQRIVNDRLMRIHQRFLIIRQQATVLR
jgi:hypothetical protein